MNCRSSIHLQLSKLTPNNGTNLLLNFTNLRSMRSRFIFEFLKKTAGQDVAVMMDTWCKHIGFPVINVKGTATATLEISQARFVQIGSTIEPHLWNVPLSAICSADSTSPVKLLLSTQSTTTTAPGGTWMKLNAGQTSFVRVNYDAEGWAALIDPIKSQKLPAVDRLGRLFRDLLLKLEQPKTNFFIFLTS